jgi:hypothetical protein
VSTRSTASCLTLKTLHGPWCFLLSKEVSWRGRTPCRYSATRAAPSRNIRQDRSSLQRVGRCLFRIVDSSIRRLRNYFKNPSEEPCSRSGRVGGNGTHDTSLATRRTESSAVAPGRPRRACSPRPSGPSPSRCRAASVAAPVVLDAALLKASLVPWRAVLSVPVQRLWPPSWSTALAANGRDVVHKVHRFERLVAVGPGDAHGERGAFAVDQQVPFGAFFGSIRGVFAGEYPPKTARKLWLSTQQCSQSMPCSWPTRWSRACRRFFQTPRRCQYWSRRQHVTPEPQPISWGSICQGMPLRSTKAMPVRQARSSTGGLAALAGPGLVPR